MHLFCTFRLAEFAASHEHVFVENFLDVSYKMSGNDYRRSVFETGKNGIYDKLARGGVYAAYRFV